MTTNAIQDLQLTTNGSTVTVHPGTARDTTDAVDITVPSSTTLSVDPSTSGIGGLDTGSVAASTDYAIWLLRNTSNQVNALMSTSFDASGVTLPSGWSGSNMRRIGAVATDSSSGLVKFFQTGRGRTRRYSWADDLDNRKVIDAGTATSWTGVAHNAYVPDSANVALVMFVADGGCTVEARSEGAERQVATQTEIIFGLNTSNDTDILEYRKTGSGGSVRAYVLGFEEVV